jgi:hypothetical protein
MKAQGHARPAQTSTAIATCSNNNAFCPTKGNTFPPVLTFALVTANYFLPQH